MTRVVSEDLLEQRMKAHQSYKTGEDKYFGVFPPHLASRCPGTSPECGRLTCHDVRLIDEQLYSLTPAEDLLNILDHDIFHMIELILSTSKLIDGWGSVKCMHQVCDGWTKASLHSICR